MVFLGVLAPVGAGFAASFHETSERWQKNNRRAGDPERRRTRQAMNGTAGINRPTGSVEGIALVPEAIHLVLEVKFLALELRDQQVVARRRLHRVVKFSLQSIVLPGELAQMRVQGHEASLLSSLPTHPD